MVWIPSVPDIVNSHPPLNEHERLEELVDKVNGFTKFFCSLEVLIALCTVEVSVKWKFKLALTSLS